MINPYIYTEVTNPVWGNAENTEIICTVNFSLLGQSVPFNARENDCMPHGVQIWNELKEGKYGEIAPYVAPVTEEVTSTSQEVAATPKRTRNRATAS